MLAKDSFFDSSSNRLNNFISSFEDAHDLKDSVFQEQGSGLLSAP